jgi:hypothetical protein
MQDHLKAYNSVGDVNIERERNIIFRASCIYVPKVNVNMNYPNLFHDGDYVGNPFRTIIGVDETYAKELEFYL